MDKLVVIILISTVMSLVTSCSSTWESDQPPIAQTYTATKDRINRNVGILRRILILPPSIKTSDCPTTPSELTMTKQVYTETVNYLENWKGYEVIINESDDLTLNKSDIEQLGEWQIGKIDNEYPPLPLLSKIKSISEENNVDGILLINGHLRCLNTADVIMYFMIVGMPNWRSKLFDENLSAGIYDAETGRLVWMHHTNVMFPSVGGGDDPTTWPLKLFGIIENAIPEVLIQKHQLSE